MIPKSVEVVLKSEVFKNFRCKLACDSLDIDAEKKSIHHLKIEKIDIPKDWNIGLIYGASGSGKTTLARNIFGENIFKNTLNDDEPILNQLPQEMNYDECANILNGIGLTSVPCWIRPVKTLSNGQRARAEAALLMTSNEGIVVIDEWTSVVDRTVAKAMSHCIQKFARKQKKQIIILSCHYDILEWVKPDWMIDCNKQEFILPKSAGFFLPRKKNLNLQSEKLGETHGNILANIII